MMNKEALQAMGKKRMSVPVAVKAVELVVAVYAAAAAVDLVCSRLMKERYLGSLRLPAPTV